MVGDTLIYDIMGDSWRSGPALPGTGFQGTVVPFGDTFVVAGGMNKNYWHQKTILKYNIASDSWETLDEMLQRSVIHPFSAFWVPENYFCAGNFIKYFTKDIATII